MKQIIILSALLIFTVAAKAQLVDSLKVQFVKDWQRVKAYTKEYLDAMPKDKYRFKAQDSIRSFAQQMLHLAQGNIGLVSNGTGAKRLAWAARNLEKSTSAQSPDSVSYFVMESYNYAIESIQKMDATKLVERNKRGNFDLDRYVWMLKAFEHQTHHRGQTTIYIRLVGIKPPNEKLF